MKVTGTQLFLAIFDGQVRLEVSKSGDEEKYGKWMYKYKLLRKEWLSCTHMSATPVRTCQLLLYAHVSYSCTHMSATPVRTCQLLLYAHVSYSCTHISATPVRTCQIRNVHSLHIFPSKHFDHFVVVNDCNF